jgi:hypothetical protein
MPRTFDLFGLNTLPTTHIWASFCKELPQDLFNTELFKLCPFIPELKLWVFWAPIFITASFESRIEIENFKF